MAKKIAMAASAVALVESGAAVDENVVLESLLSELEGTAAPIGASDEIVEMPMGDESVVEVIEPAIEAALAGEPEQSHESTSVAVEPSRTFPNDANFDELELQAAIAEATAKAYAEQGTGAAASEADKPTDTSVEAAAAPKGKGKPKAAPTERHIVLTKSQKVATKLGDKAGEFLILELADAALDEAELKAKQELVLAEIDGLAKKVAEKATQLFGWLKNGGSLNEVMKRTFEVLARDGELTSGEKGNLQQNLLAKPYSKGTAASQANQMFMLLPMLRVTKREKGRMIANPDSTILAKAKAELGL
ncbi:hypothetical protein [Paraburkholderia sp.]|uniref:hypothetical protein n=1 Tax=Paraburkholderia sp. TaxID=1926495 RepID=UPI0039E29FB1